MATLNVEEWALKSIILNTADMKVPDSLKASASDMYGRGIDLHVTQSGEPADMTDMVVYLFWRHRNGNQDATTFEEVDASTGHFRLYYPPAMLYPGEVLARIAIYIGSEKLTGSLNFIIRVEPNPVNEDEAMACESFRTFLEAVEALNSLEETVSAAEDARIAAENERQAAEEERKANEEARIAAENVRVATENERLANEETRQENEETREGNEEERTTEWEKLKEEIQAATDAANVAAGLELPLAIEHGGTGNTEGQAVSATQLVTARTIQTNLASTSAASFDGTANITPGVMGTLPLGNGGTGATTAAAARTNLSVYSQSEVDALIGKCCTCISTNSTSTIAASVNGSMTTIPWTGFAVRTTDSSYFWLSSGRLVCAKAGYVLVSGSLYIEAPSDSFAGCYLFVDDVQVAGVYLRDPRATAINTGTRIVPVSVGSFIDLKARSSVAATAYPGNVSSFLSAAYVAFS